MGAQGHIGPRHILFASAKIQVTITYLDEKLVQDPWGKVIEQGNIHSKHTDTVVGPSNVWSEDKGPRDTGSSMRRFRHSSSPFLTNRELPHNMGDHGHECRFPLAGPKGVGCSGSDGDHLLPLVGLVVIETTCLPPLF